MTIRSTFFAICTAATLAAAAFAAGPSPQQCPPHPGMMFTPEQRLMMMADIKVQADAGAIDPQVARQMQRDKLKAMTPEQRQAYADGLTKRWNALPPAEQKKMKDEGEKWRSSHPHPEGDHPNCPHPDK